MAEPPVYQDAQGVLMTTSVQDSALGVSVEGPPHAYLATALTGLARSAREEVFAVSDAVAAACRECGVVLYEPRKVTDPVHDPDIPDDEVFRLDQERVRRSDLLIYLADQPSTGAGQELVFAYEAMIPIVVVAHRDTRVSRMVTGIPGALVLVRYDGLPDLSRRLKSEISRMAPALVTRRAALHGHTRNRVGGRIRELRQSRGMSPEQLARRVGVASVTSAQVLRWEQGSDLETNFSLVCLSQIAAALEVTAADLLI